MAGMTWRGILYALRDVAEHLLLSVLCLFTAVFAAVFMVMCKMCGIDLEE